MATPNQKNSALSALSAVKTCPAPRHLAAAGIKSPHHHREHRGHRVSWVTNPKPKKLRALRALCGKNVPSALPPVILAAAGIQSPDDAPTLRWQRGRGGNPAMPSIPNQVERQPGLWIPAAARMTGAGALSVVNPPSGNASVTLGGVA